MWRIIDMGEKITDVISSDYLLVQDSEDGNVVKRVSADKFRWERGYVWPKWEPWLNWTKWEKGDPGPQWEPGPPGPQWIQWPRWVDAVCTCEDVWWWSKVEVMTLEEWLASDLILELWQLGYDSTNNKLYVWDWVSTFQQLSGMYLSSVWSEQTSSWDGYLQDVRDPIDEDNYIPPEWWLDTTEKLQNRSVTQQNSIYYKDAWDIPYVWEIILPNTSKSIEDSLMYKSNLDSITETIPTNNVKDLESTLYLVKDMTWYTDNMSVNNASSMEDSLFYSTDLNETIETIPVNNSNSIEDSLFYKANLDSDDEIIWVNNVTTEDESLTYN